MIDPVGLAWQDLGVGDPGRLWVSDVGQAQVPPNGRQPKPVVSVVAVQGGDRVPYTVSDAIVPRALLYNNQTRQLWAVDHLTEKLVRGFTVSGGVQNPVLVPGEVSGIGQLAHRPRIRGIAIDPAGISKLDGANLVWLCRGGGLCSCVELWNLAEGRLVGSFFPKCEPIDIAIDPTGDRLWILADNGPDRRTVLFERTLEGTRKQRVISASGPTGRFIPLPSTYRPSSIAASRDAVWVLTPPSGSTPGRVDGNTYAFKFEVGSPVPRRGRPGRR